MLKKISSKTTSWGLNRTIKPQTLIFAVSLFIVMFGNFSFFHNVANSYPLTIKNFFFFLSLSSVLWALVSMLLCLFSTRYTLKPTLIALVILTSFTAYFMDTFNVIIDDNMIRNVIQTNVNESIDLMTARMAVYVVLLGLVPTFLIVKTPVDYGTLKSTLISQAKIIGIGLAVTMIMLLSFSKNYASFLRNHKPLRFYSNPTYVLYSVGKFMSHSIAQKDLSFSNIGLDAHIPEADTNRRLIVVVVGEAVRSDHFSLNGYTRETNPLLKNEEIINYPKVSSCGTSTAYSVPCMFSSLARKEFSVEKANNMDNVLDLIQRSGVKVLWRDNNSDSKGVALRVPYLSFRDNTINPDCSDGECRDSGMLAGLQEIVDSSKDKSLVIVLHQMGNHGPAYYKRYPKGFEKFTPTCDTNQLENCSTEEINNSYDNALLYTDYFLSQTINFLKHNDQTFETAMIYMSDHGESLGEKGVYLHGMPYFIAPSAQKQVATVVWLGNKTKEEIDFEKMQQQSNKNYSHDYLFHSLLSFLDIKTSVYQKSLDLFAKKAS